MTRPALIDLNPVELNYHPFVVSLDKCSRICNAIDDLSTNIWVPHETKYVHVKLINMRTRINEAETFIKRISYNYKCKSYSTTRNSNQKWNNETCRCESWKYRMCQRDYSWNPSTCIYENGKYLRRYDIIKTCQWNFL